MRLQHESIAQIREHLGPGFLLNLRKRWREFNALSEEQRAHTPSPPEGNTLHPQIAEWGADKANIALRLTALNSLTEAMTGRIQPQYEPVFLAFSRLAPKEAIPLLENADERLLRILWTAFSNLDEQGALYLEPGVITGHKNCPLAILEEALQGKTPSVYADNASCWQLALRNPSLPDELATEFAYKSLIAGGVRNKVKAAEVIKARPASSESFRKTLRAVIDAAHYDNAMDAINAQSEPAKAAEVMRAVFLPEERLRIPLDGTLAADLPHAGDRLGRGAPAEAILAHFEQGPSFNDNGLAAAFGPFAKAVVVRAAQRTNLELSDKAALAIAACRPELTGAILLASLCKLPEGKHELNIPVSIYRHHSDALKPFGTCTLRSVEQGGLERDFEHGGKRPFIAVGIETPRGTMDLRFSAKLDGYKGAQGAIPRFAGEYIEPITATPADLRQALGAINERIAQVNAARVSQMSLF